MLQGDLLQDVRSERGIAHAGHNGKTDSGTQICQVPQKTSDDQTHHEKLQLKARAGLQQTLFNDDVSPPLEPKDLLEQPSGLQHRLLVCSPQGVAHSAKIVGRHHIHII